MQNFTFLKITRNTLVLLSLLLLQGILFAQTKPKKVIVFVCEHGVAKSIVAAAHFNKLAKEQNLPYEAIARSTDPQDSLVGSVLAGLRGDNLALPQKPAPKLTQSDCDAATRSIFFGTIPSTYSKRPSMQEWQHIPPVSSNYGTARDSIVTSIKHLVHELTTLSPPVQRKQP